MDNRRLGIVAAMMVVMALCGGSAGAETGLALGNPIGPGTTPPGSYEGSLVNLPSPTEASANQIITGNVSGGKYFRGPVPYSSPASFGAPLGTTRLDSFLRYSTAAGEWSELTGGYRPFYSPTATMATTQPGYPGTGFAPVSQKIAGSGLGASPPEAAAGTTAWSDLPSAQAVAEQAGPDIDAGLPAWQAPATSPVAPPPRPKDCCAVGPPLSVPSRDTPPPGMNTPADPAQGPRTAAPHSGLMTPEDYQRQLEQLQQEIERVKANAQALEQSLRAGEVITANAMGQEPLETGGWRVPANPNGRTLSPQEAPNGFRPLDLPDRSLPPAPASPGGSTTPGELETYSGPRVVDVAWLPQRDQANSETAAPGSTPAAPAVSAPQGRPAAESGSPPRGFATLPQTGRTIPASGAPTDLLRRPSPSAPLNGKPSPEQISALIERLRSASAGRTAIAGSARGDQSRTTTDSSQQLLGDRILQQYQEGNIGSSSQERFDTALAAAETDLRLGRYYRAAESFTAAAGYRPNDARPYLGKSYALFAAGEYVSSALYLARAIEIDPRAALSRSDLVNAVGGPEVFARRITDLEQCARSTTAPQLQFLLAYVYGQMNRPAEAKAAIEAAETGLPASPAVELLKTVVSRP